MSSIQFTDNEVRQALVNMGSQHWKEVVGKTEGGVDVVAPMTGEAVSPGYRRVQLSHLKVEVILGTKELQFGGEDGPKKKANLLHVFPNRTFASERLHARVSELLDRIMKDQFRVDPDHVDFYCEWIPEVQSYCVFVIGASHEPDIDERLMRVGVLLNAQLQREGVLTRA